MNRSGRRWLGLTRLPGCVLGIAVLTACAGQPAAPVIVTDTAAPSQLHGTDIGDVIARPALSLPDAAGGRFDLRRRPRGELTVLFFGYTRCPDLCPTTMADLAAARRLLPPTERARVQVVFVTEDPTRDTAPRLRAWLDGFDRSFVGLIGGNKATAQVLTALKAPRTEGVSPHADASRRTALGASATDSPTEVIGTIEHSGSVYAFAADRVIVYTGGTTPAQYAQDFGRLLSG